MESHLQCLYHNGEQTEASGKRNKERKTAKGKRRTRDLERGAYPRKPLGSYAWFLFTVCVEKAVIPGIKVAEWLPGPCEFVHGISGNGKLCFASYSLDYFNCV